MTEKDFDKLPVYDTCPFIPRLVIKEHKKLKKIADVPKNNFVLKEKDENGVELGIRHDIVLENLVIADEKTYEGSFIKLFKVDYLSSLNLYALKIFEYIMKILEINNNKVILNVEKISVNCKINEPRKIYDGLDDLISKNILAKHKVKDVYYVNPAIMFRGANRKILFTHKDY